MLVLSSAGAALMAQTAEHTLTVLVEFERCFGSDRLARLRQELAELEAAIADVPGERFDD